MGGFRPSPNFIPSNTQIGTLTSSNHQFTGSVDITGSLLINGVSITANGGGGGGGTPGGANTQIQFNNAGAFGANAAFTFDGTSVKNTGATLLATTTGTIGVGTVAPIAKLHISSSSPVPLFRIDATEQDTNKPILFVTGSGIVAIGTDSPRTDSGDTNRLHVMGESGADQGQNPAVNSVLVLENNDHVGMNIITPTNKSGMIVFGDADVANRAYFRYDHPNDRFSFDGTFGEEVMTIARAGDSVNIGKNNADHMTTSKASLHISSSIVGVDQGGPVLLRIDHADQPLGEPILFVTGSKKVGIGTSDPDANLQVHGTGSQAKFVYDDNSVATVTVAADGDLTVAALATGATASFAGDDVHVDAAKHIKLQTDGGAVYLQRPGGTTRLVFDFSTGLVTQNVPSGNPLVFRHLTNLTEIARFEGRTTEFRMSKTGSVNFRDTETGIHSPSANILEVNSKASGSTQFIVSGAFGNTDFETRSVNFSILSPSGTSIVDTTALGNNVTYIYSIEDGSFVGQEKKIFGKITFVQGQTTNSNALMITGSNIEGTSFGAPFVTAALSGAAGTGGMSMVWSGTKWLCVGANNFLMQ